MEAMELWPAEKVADRYGIPRKTLTQWRYLAKGPKGRRAPAMGVASSTGLMTFSRGSGTNQEANDPRHGDAA